MAAHAARKRIRQKSEQDKIKWAKGDNAAPLMPHDVTGSTLGLVIGAILGCSAIAQTIFASWQLGNNLIAHLTKSAYAGSASDGY